ncbi:zinc finger CCCH domain-containing protein 34-like [Andrographis paniculata]|uniref:zinc finger CCCH domain-containing protein 34-like n=1 Tax=Andrographis paniculata TaxID=175694 RepID=UPI0021E969A5|nr:zinc finger CCCH domain-containing protein 34-like [Andrographis paniculata]
MERYGGTQAMEGVPVDPVAEWATPGGQTGLEEPMWQLGLGAGSESYPERPDEPDCIYYLRTGFCGYGNRCRFNHPRDRSMAMGAMRGGGGEYPERIGQPVCQYYMRTGMCRFGASCKYHHPKQGAGSSSQLTLNYYGYPMRPGEKECSYYIKTGQCKFGITCKFHHPQPAGIPAPTPAPGPGNLAVPPALPSPALYQAVQPPVQSSQQYGIVQGNWPLPRPAMLPGSYMPGSYSPMLLPPGVVPFPGWTPYQVGVQAPGSHVASPSTQTPVSAGPYFGLAQLSPSASAYTGPYQSIVSSAGPSGSPKEHLFPQRPGQPECQYYLRTGGCKFGATCKYHHPLELLAPRSNYMISPVGLPLRPGAPICSHFAQTGVCRYGPSCKFDHPMRSLSYSPSASSLTDMPVAPYPVGSTHATLAPSSSSSDLRPELHSGFNRDAFSSASVGSIFSTGGTVPQSSFQQSSGQGSNSSSGGSSASHGGEVHTSAE